MNQKQSSCPINWLDVILGKISKKKIITRKDMKRFINNINKRRSGRNALLAEEVFCDYNSDNENQLQDDQSNKDKMNEPSNMATNPYLSGSTLNDNINIDQQIFENYSSKDSYLYDFSK